MCDIVLPLFKTRPSRAGLGLSPLQANGARNNFSVRLA